MIRDSTEEVVTIEIGIRIGRGSSSFTGREKGAKVIGEKETGNLNIRGENMKTGGVGRGTGLRREIKELFDNISFYMT